MDLMQRLLDINVHIVLKFKVWDSSRDQLLAREGRDAPNLDGLGKQWVIAFHVASQSNTK